jgi:hypothetical protein
MQQFLLYGHVLTTEEIEAHADEGVPENPPTLEQFKEQIDTYEKIFIQVEELDPVCTIDGWFRVDAKPFKQALLNIIKRWSFMFKQYLIDHVTNTLNDLAAFIKTTNAGLTKPVEEGDYDGLGECMGHLMAVKERPSTTDAIFDSHKMTHTLHKPIIISLFHGFREASIRCLDESGEIVQRVGHVIDEILLEHETPTLDDVQQRLFEGFSIDTEPTINRTHRIKFLHLDEDLLVRVDLFFELLKCGRVLRHAFVRMCFDFFRC